MPIGPGPTTDATRIDRILRSVEHVWKTYPRWTFGEVITKVLSDGDDPDGPGIVSMTDHDVEIRYARFLKGVFERSRDGT